MARDDAWEVLDTATSDMDEMSFREFVQSRLIAGPLLAIALAVTSGILAFGEAVLAPIGAFLGGFADLIAGIFGESLGIVEAGATTASRSFLEGTAALLGPAAFPAAIATTIAGLWVLVYAYNRVKWSPIGWLQRRG